MDWQNVLVGVAIFASVLHIAWSGWRQIARPSESGCSTGCANCPKSSARLITIDEQVGWLSEPTKTETLRADRKTRL